ncbi:MAG: hypothetical protein LQ352_000022 [Teloschistes flavicans]|nr:MAG: hypothetical protein LQ352_000022 [Teloschistes flavicans]
MQLQLPRDLKYPITVTELLKQPNDHVERFAPLFSYSYKTTVTEGNKYGDENQVEKSFPTKFESRFDGVVKSWSVTPGVLITQPGFEIAEIEESCSHGVQFGGMCVHCGQDMTQLTYVTDQVDATRATINLVHDKTSLVVSQYEAGKFEDEVKRRLLASKKLSLVVDLDQTVIQACVEPTIGDWKRNPDNPNHEAVKDVCEFRLVEDAAGARGCWYYIKLRPGLQGFLDRMSDLYELHIYTMGTRGYAQKIAQIIDPNRRFFGDRILSRDESGSLVAKSLQRLFPVDTKMVLIIDDRGDVWKWNDNLIKVTPYDFFVGIGDINSSFLPKKPGLPPDPRAEVLPQQHNKSSSNSVVGQDPAPKTNGDNLNETSASPDAEQDSFVATDTSALEQLVSMGGGNDPLTLQEQTTRQDETIAAQLEDRPLLKKQLQLEQDDAAKADASSGGESTKENRKRSSQDGDSVEKSRHHILEDHDRQLDYLEQSLRLVHAEYFKQYARRPASQQGGRVAEVPGFKQKQPATESSDLDSVPDVKVIMPSLKQLVLNGVVVVLSGVVPLGWDIQHCDLAMWAKSFGAKIDKEVSRRTTHLIAARNRTAKVRHALRRGKGKVKIVSPQWLVDSLAQWTRKDEMPYLLDVDDIEVNGSKDDVKNNDRDDDQLAILSESEDLASEMESEDEEALKKRTMRLKPALKIETGDNYESDVEAGLLPDELEDQHSPVGGTHDDWEDMNAELNEFLGSDAEDSEGGGSISSVGSSRSSKSTMAQRSKRAREEEDNDHEGGLRKRPAPSRRTHLGDDSVAAATASQRRPDVDSKGEGSSEAAEASGSQIEQGENSEDGDDWAELEQEFAAEMARVAAEESES